MRMIVYLIIGALVVLFASQNLEIVPVYIFTGSAIEVPLIMIVAVSFLAGFVTAIISVIRKAIQRHKRKGRVMIDPRRSM